MEGTFQPKIRQTGRPRGRRNRGAVNVIINACSLLLDETTKASRDMVFTTSFAETGHSYRSTGSSFEFFFGWMAVGGLDLELEFVYRCERDYRIFLFAFQTRPCV
jgi:hypothetical protein